MNHDPIGFSFNILLKIRGLDWKYHYRENEKIKTKSINAKLSGMVSPNLIDTSNNLVFQFNWMIFFLLVYMILSSKGRCKNIERYYRHAILHNTALFSDNITQSLIAIFILTIYN
jgi:hypothetical protein